MYSSFTAAIVDADFLIYTAAWASREHPFESHAVLRKKIEEMCNNLKVHTDHIVLAATSKEVPLLRDSIYTMAKYKGKRVDEPAISIVKEQLRQTLMGFCVSVPGYEADDILYSFATAFPSVLMVSADKDLNNVPGYHINPKKMHEVYRISAEEALHTLWMQVLTGDTVDNIRGIPKIGPIKAQQLLKHCDSASEYATTALAAYTQYFGVDKGRQLFQETVDTVKFYDVFELLSPEQKLLKKIDDLLVEVTG